MRQRCDEKAQAEKTCGKRSCDAKVQWIKSHPILLKVGFFRAVTGELVFSKNVIVYMTMEQDHSMNRFPNRKYQEIGGPQVNNVLDVHCVSRT